MEYARDGQIVPTLRRVLSAIWNWRMMRCALRALWWYSASGFCAAGCCAGYYARENGAGTMFEPEAAYDEVPAS